MVIEKHSIVVSDLSEWNELASTRRTSQLLSHLSAAAGGIAGAGVQRDQPVPGLRAGAGMRGATQDAPVLSRLRAGRDLGTQQRRAAGPICRAAADGLDLRARAGHPAQALLRKPHARQGEIGTNPKTLPGLLDQFCLKAARIPGLASSRRTCKFQPCRTKTCFPESRWTRKSAMGNPACAVCVTLWKRFLISSRGRFRRGFAEGIPGFGTGRHTRRS